MHILAREPRRLGDQHAIKGGGAQLIAQTIQPWTASAPSAGASTPKNGLLFPLPSLLLTVFTRAYVTAARWFVLVRVALVDTRTYIAMFIAVLLSAQRT